MPDHQRRVRFLIHDPDLSALRSAASTHQNNPRGAFGATTPQREAVRAAVAAWYSTVLKKPLALRVWMHEEFDWFLREFRDDATVALEYACNLEATQWAYLYHRVNPPPKVEARLGLAAFCIAVWSRLKSVDGRKLYTIQSIRGAIEPKLPPRMDNWRRTLAVVIDRFPGLEDAFGYLFASVAPCVPDEQWSASDERSTAWRVPTIQQLKQSGTDRTAVSRARGSAITLLACWRQNDAP